MTATSSSFRVFSPRRAVRHVPRSPGVLAIVLLSVAVVALTDVVPSVAGALEARSSALASGQYWRLLTYVFPHDGGWPHVLLNMAILCLYGWQLERMVGTLRFASGYLGAGAVSMSLLFSFRQIDATTGLTAGASLAVFAVVTAIAVLYVASGPPHRRDVILATGTIIVLVVVSGVISMARRSGHQSAAPSGLEGMVYGVANHSMGVISGVLLGSVLSPNKRARVLALGVAIALTIAGLAVGTSHARWG